MRQQAASPDQDTANTESNNLNGQKGACRKPDIEKKSQQEQVSCKTAPQEIKAYHWKQTLPETIEKERFIIHSLIAILSQQINRPLRFSKQISI